MPKVEWFLKESDSIKDGKWLRSEVLVTQLCLFATLWPVAHQAPLSIGFSRQEYQSGQTFPSSGALPDPVIKSRSPALELDSLPSEPLGWPIKCMRLSIFWNCREAGHWRAQIHLFQDKDQRLQGISYLIPPTHLSETSSHLPSLGALPPCSPESHEEPQSLVPLHHHHNPHQGHQSSDLGLLRAEQGSDETTVRGLVWEIPKILLTQSFWAAI